MTRSADHIKWFRDSSPYIDAHRDKTFVVYIGGEALDTPNIIADIALLNALGVKLILVYGAREQINNHLESLGLGWGESQTGRITTPELMEPISAAVGQLKLELEARLSMGVLNSPIKGNEVNTSSGNYIKAQPLGIVDGIDHHLTGAVRGINASLIRSQLDQHSIVIVSPIGYSPSGEMFNLDAMALARDVACSLKSDKLVYFTNSPGVYDETGSLISEIDLSEKDGVTIARKSDEGVAKALKFCDHACRNDVARCHIISYEIDGAILEELYTRDGCGTQIIGHSYEQIRGACPDDVAGILKLIEPLEETGILVKRSRELLESEIEKFTVIERDGLLVSCAALYQFGESGELACLVTHPDYRNGDRGDRLLDVIERKARAASLKQLFVLTTQSAHWFVERGFVETEIDSLPAEKQAFYNYQRNSKVLFLNL